MEIKVKIFDINQLPDEYGRRYQNLDAVFEQFNCYMKRKDRYVLDNPEYMERVEHVMKLEDIIGEVTHIEWKDQSAFANIHLLDTPKGTVYQELLSKVPEHISIEPFFSYRKLGDKMVDLQLEDLFINIKKKDDD